MLSSARVLLLVLYLGCGLGIPSSAQAQEEWTWPEHGMNFKVLPKDFPPQKLQAVMKGFTRALGVRCTYCHVGEEGKPLSTYDFASDANPNKDRARAMYNMLGTINDQLKKIEPSGDRRVNMWCHTCHQGKPRPLTLQESLSEAHRKSGVDGMLARYRDLREKYYGRSAYDFGERTLNEPGYEFLGKADHAAAIALLRMNTVEFSRSTNAWDGLGEAYLAAGKRTEAESSYRKAIEVDPKNKNAAQKLDELAKKPPGR